MKQPLISIIVPVYNTAKYLDRCIESTVNQAYKNIEIILVDDGSTDDSGEICDNYAKIDSRIKVVHQENGGVSKARNTALGIANGEYIGFVDSDDSIEFEMYEKLLKSLQENDADIVICNQSKIAKQSRLDIRQIKEFSTIDKKEALKEVLLSRAFCGGPCNKLFKRSICEGLKFPEDIFFGEDLVFVVQAIRNSNKIALVPDFYYNYYERNESATTGKFNDKRYTDVISRKRVFELVEQENDFELTELAHVSIILADLTMLQQLFYDKEAQKKYCKDIQSRVRENFKYRRMKYVDISTKINTLSVVVSYKLFFVIVCIKNIIKKIINRL